MKTNTKYIIGGLAALVCLQTYAIFGGGVHKYQSARQRANQAQQNQARKSKNGISHSKNVNTDNDVHTHANDYFDATGFSPSVRGTYVHNLPPLNTNERPYYSIYILVNIQQKHIYQQFVMVPLRKDIPKNVENHMYHSSLLNAVRHYNVRASLKKTIHSGSKLVTFDSMKYDKVYNTANERQHFIQVTPFVIPPTNNKTQTSHASFTKNGLNANGTHFNKISENQAKQLLKRGLTDLKSVGY